MSDPASPAISATAPMCPPGEAGASGAVRGSDPPRGWTAIADDDVNRIARRAPERFGSLLAVWYVLVREARFQRSHTFRMGRGVLADRAKMGATTVEELLRLLHALEMVKWRSERDHATGRQGVRIITIRPTVSPCALLAQTVHGAPCTPAHGGENEQALTVGGLQKAPPTRKTNLRKRIAAPLGGGAERPAEAHDAPDANEPIVSMPRERVWS